MLSKLDRPKKHLYFYLLFYYKFENLIFEIKIKKYANYIIINLLYSKESNK